mmetsp:Transcript_104573/g.293044  ORF Transcript_104573/g.293044 Transcript_104573/m.293044 type:complete len:116 (-) Transcript_104573:566-913(-)
MFWQQRVFGTDNYRSRCGTPVQKIRQIRGDGMSKETSARQMQNDIALSISTTRSRKPALRNIKFLGWIFRCRFANSGHATHKWCGLALVALSIEGRGKFGRGLSAEDKTWDTCNI